MFVVINIYVCLYLYILCFVFAYILIFCIYILYSYFVIILCIYILHLYSVLYSVFRIARVSRTRVYDLTPGTQRLQNVSGKHNIFAQGNLFEYFLLNLDQIWIVNYTLPIDLVHQMEFHLQWNINPKSVIIIQIWFHLTRIGYTRLLSM